MFLSSHAQETKNKAKHFGKEISNTKISPDGYVRCLTDEYEQYLQEKNPKRLTNQEFEAWINPLIQKQKNEQSTHSQSGGIIYIPVVVHVIHNGDAYGVNENITDEQVQSQITVMTQDFRRMAGTPGFNSNPVGADTTIEFVLAKVDPNGNPTNGINRVNLCEASWSTDDINNIVKPSTIWNPTQYMNMWSVNFSDNTLLGYAQFPSNSTLGGLNANEGDADTDGVVAGYQFFGSRTIYPAGNYGSGTTYDKGRTMTHEVGHYLGLRHIWGDGGCTVDDFCNDTPLAAAANYGCPTGTDSCTEPGIDMIQNYMDYTDDSCMNIFTNDQKTRITTVMNNSPRRLELKTSTKDLPIALFANDAEVKIENSCNIPPSTCASPNPTSAAKSVLLYNRGTSNLTSATISYNMNGGANYNQNWTGNLAPNKYAVITLTNTTTSGTLNVSIASTNGVTDQRTTNNTDSKTFGQPLGYANSTTFTFNLVGDSYSSETTWSLKNQAGTTLYSGGPYGDIATGTQVLENNTVWNLPANGCYYLTVNDSWGDGLFDGVSQGYYTVTAGTTTVVNVPDFVESGNPDNTLVSRVSYFTNNGTLSTDNFSLLEDINLYPNPTKDILNISIPSGLGSLKTYEIYNNLGQTIKTNKPTNNDFAISTSEFSNGVYFIKLNFENTSKTLRFVKN